MDNTKTVQSSSIPLQGESANITISRRTFGALAGASTALLWSQTASSKSAVVNTFRAPRFAKNVDNAIVYRKEDEFASHPYVRGFWETAAGHLICNFSDATVDYHGDPKLLAHIDLVRSPLGRRAVTVRSEDRGQTWKVWNADKNRSSNDVRAPQPGIDGKLGSLSEIGPIDYTNKDVLIANFNYQYMRDDALIKDFVASMLPITDAPERQVFIRVSKDAGHTWSRSVMLPSDGLYSLAAVESFIVRPDGQCLLFLSGASKQGSPGRPLVYRSMDDGTSFHFMSYVTPKEDPTSGGIFQMYPRGLMLPSGRMLCFLRIDRDWSGDMWTEVYKSDDGGRTWQFLSRANDFGAPAAPVRMRDGRLVLVYGSRLPTPGIRAVVSEDEGLTWGQEIIVRNDGGSWDLGYPRAWEASPGKIGAIYYYNSKDDPVQLKPTDTLWGAGGVRFIARSFFSID